MSPTYFEITDKENRITILTHHFRNSTGKTVLEILKKRNIPARDEVPELVDGKDPYIIDMEPDIIFFGGMRKTETANYKGITLLSSEFPEAIVVDLRTRESEIISF